MKDKDLAAKKKANSLIDDMMETAMRVDHLERMYQFDADKNPVIEFFFEEISDLAAAEYKILNAMSKHMRLTTNFDKVAGYSEFADCREYTVGPVTYRLRCEKLLDTKGGPRLGVRDILFTHRTH